MAPAAEQLTLFDGMCHLCRSPVQNQGVWLLQFVCPHCALTALLPHPHNR